MHLPGRFPVTVRAASRPAQAASRTGRRERSADGAAGRPPSNWPIPRVVGRIELPTSSTLRMNHTTRPNDRPHPAPHVPLHQTLPPSHQIPTLQILSRTLSTALETHTFSHILKFPTPLTPSTAHCHPPLSTFIPYFLTQTPLTPRIYPFSDSRSGMFVVVFFN